MPDYKKGKIYKIVCNVTGKVYIGSTIETLARRLTGHRATYKRFKGGKSHNCSSFQIIEQGNYDIVLIENCPCESKEELHRRERYFIESLDCLNKVIPTRTDKEWRNDNKETLKEKATQYRQDNIESIKEKANQYYQDNKIQIKQYYHDNQERIKQYFQDNKDTIRLKMKQYIQDNKDAIREKQKKYHQGNKDIQNEKNRQYYHHNKDVLLEQRKQYQQNNKDAINEKRKLRRLKKKSENEILH